MKGLHLLLVLMILILIAGCASRDPISPVQESEFTHQADVESHQLWGLWQFKARPDTGQLDVELLRSGALHLNALPFLEPPGLVYLTIDDVQFNGNLLDAVIGLRHPFVGLDQFTGFDVAGILITSGSLNGFDDANIIMPGEEDTRLLNADGYTRWWNPSEFPQDGSIFAYQDGILGTPDSVAGFSCTLNGYRTYCNDLSNPDDEIDEVLTPDNRCFFRVGMKNRRLYKLSLDGGLIFNYALDASWKFPLGDAPWNVPNDFPPGANKPEAWNVSVTELENTLWNDGEASGGGIEFLIDVWDHFNAGSNTVLLESPENLPGSIAAGAPIGGGEGYSTYHVDIDSAAPSVGAAEGAIDFLISVESEIVGYQGLLPGEPVTAYFVHRASVSDTPPSGSTLHLIAPNGGESIQQKCGFTIKWESFGDPIADVRLQYSTDGFIAQIFPIIDSTPNTGTFGWEIPNVVSDSVRVRVSDVLAPSVKDDSDADLSIFESGDAIWPMYKYDLGNTGQSPNVGPSTNNLEWEFTCNGGTTPGPSIGADGTIYIGTNTGRVHAVNPDGTEKYTLDLGSFVLGTPAIAGDGTIYAGTWGAGRMFALKCDGEIDWEFDTQGDVNKSHPVIGEDGTIYVGNNNGRFFAINPDGTEKWNYSSGGGYVPSPAIGPGGEVYFVASSGNAYGFHDLGQGSYDLFWQHTFSGEHMSNSPSVDDQGVVYCLGLYLNTVWACDPYTDTILWTFDAPDGFDEASVSIDDDYTIYIGCNDNNMYAVNPGGTVKWSTPVSNRTPSSVIIDPAGHLYFGTRGGDITDIVGEKGYG